VECGTGRHGVVHRRHRRTGDRSRGAVFGGRRVEANLFAADQGPGGGVIATLVLTPNAWWC